MRRHRSKYKEYIIENVEVGEPAEDGKCVTRIGEKVAFIEGVVPGDVIDVRITADKKSYLEGVAQKIHSYSSLRVKPFCSHFGVCGGCSRQNLDYATQLRFKEKQVRDALQRIGKAVLPEMNPIIPAPLTVFYRNKLEFTFSSKRWLTENEIQTEEKLERNALGFHIPKRFDKILDIEQCYLQPEPSNTIRLAIKEYAVAQGLEFNELRSQKGFLRNLIIRTAGTGQVMVIVQVYPGHEAEIVPLMDFIAGRFPEIASLNYVVNGKGNETFNDLEVVCHKGRPYIEEEMEGLIFRVGPKSFYQTNGAQAHALYNVALGMAGLTQTELVYDLYTGTGSIANFVARRAKKVIGVEYVEMSVEEARLNSTYNNLDNTEFYSGDMREVLNDAFVAQHGQPDVIITDPPRAGMHIDVVEVLLRIKAKRIVYISCNPATQARDLALLNNLYEVKQVQPVDMFPHTHHVENVLQLELRSEPLTAA